VQKQLRLSMIARTLTTGWPTKTGLVMPILEIAARGAVMRAIVGRTEGMAARCCASITIFQ
jgi:hypothetical protein